MKPKQIYLINIYIMSLLAVVYAIYSLNKAGLPSPMKDMLGATPTAQEANVKATRGQ